MNVCWRSCPLSLSDDSHLLINLHRLRPAELFLSRLAFGLVSTYGSSHELISHYLLSGYLPCCIKVCNKRTFFRAIVLNIVLHDIAFGTASSHSSAANT